MGTDEGRRTVTTTWKDVAKAFPPRSQSPDAPCAREMSRAASTPSTPHAVTSPGESSGDNPPLRSPIRLHTAWSLYYHRPSSADWTMNSYTKVATLVTAEEFCGLCRVFEHEVTHMHMGMFFLMRGDIMPTWEDPHNRKGGCWSYKVPMSEMGKVWKALSTRLVGERLSDVPLLLNGISMSPKRGFCIVKVWNHDANQSKASVLHVEDIPKLNNFGEPIYTAFSDKK